jgi:N-acetylmuramoyl-L-alanine amidase
MRKLKLVGVQIVTFICFLLFLPLNSYESNAVEKSSVSCEKITNENRGLNSEYVKNDKELKIISYITPTPTPEIEIKVMSFSTEIKTVKNESKYSDEEIEILERVVEAELTGCSYESKKNATSVIINRTKSDSFPDSIKEVVFQKSQFSSVSDHRYYEVTITKETKKAVKDVINNGVVTDALYFFNLRDIESQKIKNWINSKLVFLFKDDAGHSYYKEKEDD